MSLVQIVLSKAGARRLGKARDASVNHPVKYVGNILLWDKLPNSGDTLKVIVPSYIRKNICGWINSPGKVISYNMKETKMGYRGSKSVLEQYSNTVKEQRVDGNCREKNYKLKQNNSSLLRCTLMGFERNYQIKIPSKQLTYFKQLNYKKNFSTSNYKPKLNPYFVTGLADAESSFIVSIQKNERYKIGWRVLAAFQIGLHERDLALLLQLQEFFFGKGSMAKEIETKMVRYQIADIDDLTKIVIPHFLKYPLLTQKGADFILFKQIVKLMNSKNHLSIEGLHQIVDIRASMNRGLSSLIKSEFINNTPVVRPSINTTQIPDPQWISGFTCGEGNFDIGIKKSKNKIGYQVLLRFRLWQHDRDLKLMELIIEYLRAGRLEIEDKRNSVCITVMKLYDLTHKIIPLFEKNKIIGVKQLDFEDFAEVAKLMHLGLHLTDEGLKLIRSIKLKIEQRKKN